MATVEKVFVNNFKSIERCEVSLRRGVIAIVGANGSGKSNLFEAICLGMVALVGVQCARMCLHCMSSCVSECECVWMWVRCVRAYVRVRVCMWYGVFPCAHFAFFVLWLILSYPRSTWLCIS
jgi:RecF/RecN/SMC N terminal domain